MRILLRISLAAVIAASTSNSLAFATAIGGTHGRAEIKSTCASSGGNYYSNLDGYGCMKENCDGKGGLCGVVCKNDGKCEGSTPSITSVPAPKGLKGILNPKTR